MTRLLSAGLWSIPVLGVSLALLLQLPQEPTTAEILASKLNLAPSQSPKTGKSAAQLLCESLTTDGLNLIDCRTGTLIGATPLSGPVRTANPSARAELITYMADYDVFYQALSSQLAGITASIPVTVFQYRVNQQLETTRTLRSILREPNLTGEQYRKVFDELRALEGIRYSSTSGIFSRSSWHLGRVFDNGEKIQQRGSILNTLLQPVAWLIVPVIAVTNIALIIRFGLLGAITGLLFSSSSLLSVVIAANASLRFGGDSSAYIFSPLADQFQRQFLITIALHLILIGVVTIAPKISVFFKNWKNQLSWFALLLLPASLMGYLTSGHATGSELLKIGIATIAATSVNLFTREIFLNSKYSLNAAAQWQSRQNAPRQLIDARPSKNKSTTPEKFLSKRFFSSLGLMVFFSLACLGLSALVFSDFGGTLVATSILMSMALMVFGKRIGGIAIAVIVIGGIGALFTRKVQGRVELMLEPMRAKVSDFARLLEFESSGQPYGHGIKDIPWCNSDGVCVPVQILSDYMPTLLSTAFGSLATHGIFFLSCLGFIFIGIQTLRIMISGSDSVRLFAGISFFLALGCLVQLLVTFLGNWHLIPLTGLGAPMFSIGVSSGLAPTMTIALWLASKKVEP